ncbi:hypothetical protein IFM89_001676 [Coptis chinensis]|uniref:Uncharacterized protein n=1 Tax=Coptis chinensis TaxID=261450 RepID=A0A835HI65_9MAGN|nr:hypothetical protein IFM89_001676 [Coptis chinensis]
MHVLCAVEIIICKACLQANIVVSRCEEPNPNFKLQRLLYLVHGALPLLWPTSCLEQDSEIEMEAESQGLECAEVNIRRIKLDEDERQYCDNCNTSIFKFQRSCPILIVHMISVSHAVWN